MYGAENGEKLLKFSKCGEIVIEIHPKLKWTQTFPNSLYFAQILKEF